MDRNCSRTSLGRRVAACALPVLVLLATFLAPVSGQALSIACGEVENQKTLVARCTDGVCMDGFLIHYRPYPPYNGVCDERRPILADLGPSLLPISEIVRDLGAEVRTGIYEIAVYGLCYGRNEPRPFNPTDENGETCLQYRSETQVSERDDRQALVQHRAIWDAREQKAGRQAAMSAFGMSWWPIMAVGALTALSIIGSWWLALRRPWTERRITLLFLATLPAHILIGGLSLWVLGFHIYFTDGQVHDFRLRGFYPLACFGLLMFQTLLQGEYVLAQIVYLCLSKLRFAGVKSTT